MNIDRAALTEWVKTKLLNANTVSETKLLLELADDFNLFDIDSELSQLSIA